MRVESGRVDIRRAAAECDAGMLHAGQGTTAAMLLGGKPILQVPLVLEQRLTAQATVRLGAGLVLNDRGKDREAAGLHLRQLLGERRYTDAASRFAQKYASFDPDIQVRRMVDRIAELATGAE